MGNFDDNYEDYYFGLDDDDGGDYDVAANCDPDYEGEENDCPCTGPHPDAACPIHGILAVLLAAGFDL